VYAEQLEALLRESVQLRLMSDVPFGAFLSGGLDSSLIVALMSQLLNVPVKTFAVGFENTDGAENELPYARLVAERYRTEHYEVNIRPHDFIELAEKVVWHLDQPVADEAALANLMVAELASHHVKMVLSGEGGDELFAGYARYAGERLSPLFRCLPRAAKSLALAASERLPGLRRPKLALHALCQPDEVTRLTNWFPLLNTDMKQALLTAKLQSGLPAALPESVFAHHLARTETRDPLHRMLYVDTKLWLPDDLLARGDKMSMAASIEARVPLLDHKLVEFAALLPPSLKVRRLTRKYLLKKVSRDWLPPQIISRKKQGFPVPFGDWFRREARPFVRDILAPDAIRRRGLFNPPAIAKLLDEHETGFADHSAPLWGLLSVELWHRLFIDSQAGRARPEPCPPSGASHCRAASPPRST
jgi:asparagine synthase (glutamine-hydrolysing)